LEDVLVDELVQLVELFNFHKQVAGLGLGVVGHVERDDLEGDLRQRFLRDFFTVPLDRNLARQVANVFVAPRADFFMRAEHPVLECLLSIGIGHCQNGNDVGAKTSIFRHSDLLIDSLEAVEMCSEELEWLWHRSHGRS